MAPFALAGLSLLQFIILARVVFFDSWDEFKLSFRMLRHPLGLLRHAREERAARFATSKLLLLVGYTAILSFLVWTVSDAGWF